MAEHSGDYEADDAAALSLWDAGLVRPEALAHEVVAHMRSQGWRPLTESSLSPAVTEGGDHA